MYDLPMTTRVNKPKTTRQRKAELNASTTFRLTPLDINFWQVNLGFNPIHADAPSNCNRLIANRAAFEDQRYI